MRNREMQVAIQALNKLSTIKLPVKTALKVRNMMRSLHHLAEDVEAERIKLIEELAEKDDTGKPVIENNQFQFGARLGEFNTAYEELMNCDAAGMPSPLKAYELDGIAIEPLLLYQLGDLLVDEEPPVASG